MAAILLADVAEQSQDLTLVVLLANLSNSALWGCLPLRVVKWGCQSGIGAFECISVSHGASSNPRVRCLVARHLLHPYHRRLSGTVGDLSHPNLGGASVHILVMTRDIVDLSHV